MIVFENQDSKKYSVLCGSVRHFVGKGEKVSLYTNRITVTRAYSKNTALNLLIKAALFMLCVLFVFLDTDYEHDEFSLVLVKFKCVSVSDSLSLSFVSSPLININKSGELNGEFVIQKSLLIAHIISVCLYSAAVIVMLIFLGVFTVGEAISPLFFALSGASGAFAVYIIFYTIKRYKKTLAYLHDYFGHYVY